MPASYHEILCSTLAKSSQSTTEATEKKGDDGKQLP